MAKKEGKYASILPGLPKVQPEDASYQAKVDIEKESVKDRDPIVLAQFYMQLRRGDGPITLEDEDLVEKIIDRFGEDGIEEIAKKIRLRITAREQLLVESREAEEHGWGLYGVKDNALRLPTGETIRVQPEPIGQVMDKEAFRIWCVRNGYERKLQLWPSSMNAIVKERLLAGAPLPDGCKAFAKDKIVLVKAEEQ